MSEQRQRIAIDVPVLARVEGEGALELHIEDGAITDLKLRIFEPPRLFEKFLEGNSPQQIIDRVARICGICPVAYQMTAVQAIERAAGLSVTPWVADMRRVFYCGEWLQSHALHLHLLAAPDFFQCASVAELATLQPQTVRRGLRLQTLGNDLIALFGGRSVHPLGVCPGGFFRAPVEAAVSAMRERLVQARQEAVELLHWVAGWSVPDSEQEFVAMALSDPHCYAIEQGDLQISDGRHLPVEAFETEFQEHQVAHSTALHCLYQGQPYLVGPLARMNLNGAMLPDEIQAVLAEVGNPFPSRNMFHSALARAAEILLVITEAGRLLTDYARPGESHADCPPASGVACAATEAPRGLLWHRYRFDEAGRARDIRIVPPTSQNQARIEQDLFRTLTTYGLEHSADELRVMGETVIRNYDPCISCATHFLRMQVNRARA